MAPSSDKLPNLGLSKAFNLPNIRKMLKMSINNLKCTKILLKSMNLLFDIILWPVRTFYINFACIQWHFCKSLSEISATETNWDSVKDVISLSYKVSIWCSMKYLLTIHFLPNSKFEVQHFLMMVNFLVRPSTDQPKVVYVQTWAGFSEKSGCQVPPGV